MNVSILTVFSQLYDTWINTSLARRAQEQGLITVDVEEFRSFADPKERIDAPTFGHGAGMLIKPEIVEKAISAQEAKHGKAYRIFFSPHGKKLTQPLLQEIAAQAQKQGHLMCIAGRYEGMDARVEEVYADEIISIGDYVLMGGDLPTMVLLEGLLRHIPGVVGRAESVVADSFSGPFVDYPEYTQPVVWHDRQVPDVLRSGNHATIAAWRQEQAAKRTVEGHFQWLRSHIKTSEQKKLALKHIPTHYVALMHSDVVIGDAKKEGTTSVTSLDIHDIARSSKTFGISQFFLVTPLVDQQKIVRTLLDFWQEGAGIEYNPARHQAVKQVQLVNDLDEVKKAIVSREGKEPLVIATSARVSGHQGIIDYTSQELVWSHNRPVLLVFGTGNGLSEAFLQRCDYLLMPVEGLTGYNHLSVRSAAAIVLDRWLGLQSNKNMW